MPTVCYKADATLQARADVVLLIGTMRFWGLDEIPKELVTYALNKGFFLLLVTL